MTAISIPSRSGPTAAAWAGWTLTGLVTAFLIMDGTMKVLQLPIVVSTTQQLGYDPAIILPLGIGILAIAALYAVPRTAVLGALLLTALLGGTVATHLIAGNPLVSHALFGVYLGVAAWGGLWLREPRLRALLPLRL
ncbi:DoxX family protein [Phenylobacterium sp.]|jgi:hypothetical protein|uniref:DoxX family protein n=1 Tax=Phenylobacterium sp. TaxID=1871053 RepID=UPI002F93B25A